MLRATALWLGATLLLGGCASEGPPVSERLDLQTGVTIRALTEPLQYAHDAPELAANARDYLSVGVVEINNMGVRRHYLALVSWSTINRARAGVAPAPVPQHVEIACSGATLALDPASHEPRSLGIGGTPFRPATGYVGESWYAVTPAQLRALAATLPESIALRTDGAPVTYVPWRASPGALGEFVRDIPDPGATRPQR